MPPPRSVSAVERNGVVVVFFSPLSFSRAPCALLRERDALPSFLAATLLGRGRRPWEKRRPRQKEAGDAGAQLADWGSIDWLVKAESAVQ